MQIKCPYCFETFNPNQSLFRCTNASCSGFGPDHNYSSYRDIHPPENMGRTFEGPDGIIDQLQDWFRVRTSAVCDICENETMKRVCPHCHQELSHDAGLLPERTIAVIGPRASGKSNYIAVLIHELRNRVLQNFDKAYIQTIGDQTITRYRDGFGSHVYGENPRAVPATLTSQSDDATVRIPLIYRITFGRGRGAQAVNLVLFDTAGEDMNSLDILSAEARYITTADGLIYLVDPTQISQVRQQLGKDKVGLRLKNANPVEIINRLYTLYEQTKQIPVNTPIKKPVAFAVSKIDVIEPILPPGNSLHRNSEHFGGVNLDDINAVHGELEPLLSRWGLASEIDPRFDTYRFFGFSAFGGPPNPDDSLDYVEPKRVEDPILWILNELNIVQKG